jgi:adenine deaminase
MKIRGNIIDLYNRNIYFGEIKVTKGIIEEIKPVNGKSKKYILPGFVDAHVHIESSMLVPTEFARLSVVHGTVATVSDPHEIANVLGIKGVDFMLRNAAKSPFKFFFGAPSCVPATSFETAGAELDSKDVEKLLERPDIWYLSEMMNYPGVLFDDKEVMLKLAAARKNNKPVDGHAPGLRGAEAKKYFSSGISTDHECFTYEEGLEKAMMGVKILIREGSAAKNFEALIPLILRFPDQVMFCSDDKHPDDLILGHINQLVARALHKGYDLMDVLRVACINPVQHYQLPVGTLREGDAADFIVTDDITQFHIRETWIKGKKVARNGKSLLKSIRTKPVNHFKCRIKKPADFRIKPKGTHINVIKALDGQIVTDSFQAKALTDRNNVVSNMPSDILKFTVVNRYRQAAPAIGFIHHFGLRHGAIASSVGHDSHNILAVGTDDELLCEAVNLIIQNKGGIAALDKDGHKMCMPLPVGGIMTNVDGYNVAKQYAEIDHFVKNNLESTLTAPFMTLSFMALLVIPELKLSDKGLFDGRKFEFRDIFV